MCKKCGWTHKESPLIWRELVHQGGKELFLGGFNDFLEHCQVIVEKKIIIILLLTSKSQFTMLTDCGKVANIG